ncbi:MAG: ABC transporter ATP-binding protein [Candidatus Omnitrophota bacterium]
MLEAKNIHKIYSRTNKDVEVLKGLELRIDKGVFAAVVGPSGAGKSTLLHILGGLDSPTTGAVYFKGKDIYSLKDSALCELRNKSIGFVFQFYHLLQEFTVIENVLMPAMVGARGSFGNNEKKSALELLDMVGLDKRGEHFPSELSGGEQQRVALVRALINNPEILFCDEPTGNLDSQSGKEVISLIRSLNKDKGMTVVLVTHNLELVGSTDRLCRLEDGKLG